LEIPPHQDYSSSKQTDHREMTTRDQVSQLYQHGKDPKDLTMADLREFPMTCADPQNQVSLDKDRVLCDLFTELSLGPYRPYGSPHISVLINGGATKKMVHLLNQTDKKVNWKDILPYASWEAIQIALWAMLCTDQFIDNWPRENLTMFFRYVTEDVLTKFLEMHFPTVCKHNEPGVILDVLLSNTSWKTLWSREKLERFLRLFRPEDLAKHMVSQLGVDPSISGNLEFLKLDFPWIEVLMEAKEEEFQEEHEKELASAIKAIEWSKYLEEPTVPGPRVEARSPFVKEQQKTIAMEHKFQSIAGPLSLLPLHYLMEHEEEDGKDGKDIGVHQNMMNELAILLKDPSNLSVIEIVTIIAQVGQGPKDTVWCVITYNFIKCVYNEQVTTPNMLVVINELMKVICRNESYILRMHDDPELTRFFVMLREILSPVRVEDSNKTTSILYHSKRLLGMLEEYYEEYYEEEDYYAEAEAEAEAEGEEEYEEEYEEEEEEEYEYVYKEDYEDEKKLEYAFAGNLENFYFVMFQLVELPMGKRQDLITSLGQHIISDVQSEAMERVVIGLQNMTPFKLKGYWKELIEDYPLSFIIWLLHDGVTSSTIINILSSCSQGEHTSFQTLLAISMKRKTDREEFLDELHKVQPNLSFEEFEELLAYLMKLSDNPFKDVGDWFDILNSRNQGEGLVKLWLPYAELDPCQLDQMMYRLTDGLYRGDLNLALLAFYFCDNRVSSEMLKGKDKNGSTYLECLNDPKPDGEWSRELTKSITKHYNAAVWKKQEREMITDLHLGGKPIIFTKRSQDMLHFNSRR